MLSALTGREISEPDLSPATQQHRLGCFLLPWRPGAVKTLLPRPSIQWSLGHTPYSGAMLIPIVVSLGPPEQRCQISHGILKIYLGQEID